MTLPYEKATTGGAALTELNKILTKFGCTRFGTMTDTENGTLILQFTYRGRDVTVPASTKGYAAAWLKEHPYSSRSRCTRVEYERKALAQAEISVCSILRDWIKGQTMAVECGLLSFEGAFLGQIMLPGSGKSVLDAVMIDGMLPALEGPKK
jgi:hypothetical protein